MTESSSTRPKARWNVLVVVLCVGVVVATIVVASLYTPPRSLVYPESKKRSQASTGIRGGPLSLREREDWAPGDFFDSKQAIQACELISERKHDQLNDLIKSGLDVNQSGKHGATLLHWAFADNDLEAFKLLLEAGADPDKPLTEPVNLRDGWFFPGDSILFTSMRSREQKKWDFFFAALEHTKDVNQRDGAGNTLLLACMGYHAIFSTSDETLQRLLDSGIALDVKNKYGDTAAMTALGWSRPLHCLRILEAGADPEIQNQRGRTVADLMAIELKRSQGKPKESRPAGLDRLEQWLKTHADQKVDQLPLDIPGTTPR